MASYKCMFGGPSPIWQAVWCCTSARDTVTLAACITHGVDKRQRGAGRLPQVATDISAWGNSPTWAFAICDEAAIGQWGCTIWYQWQYTCCHHSGAVSIDNDVCKMWDRKGIKWKGAIIWHGYGLLPNPWLATTCTLGSTTSHLKMDSGTTLSSPSRNATCGSAGTCTSITTSPQSHCFNTLSLWTPMLARLFVQTLVVCPQRWRISVIWCVAKVSRDNVVTWWPLCGMTSETCVWSQRTLTDKMELYVAAMVAKTSTWHAPRLWSSITSIWVAFTLPTRRGPTMR